jgi:DNA-binding NarL/FixJ family response regulator
MDWDAGPESGSTESGAEVSGRTGSVGVLVVDDSPVFRRGMGRAVRFHTGLELVGEADVGQAALEAIERLQPDVVLLDLAMPVLDGFEAMPMMLERSPGTTIVALSGFTAERMAHLCIASGAHAYLEKGEDVAVIREAVISAAIAA